MTLLLFFIPLAIAGLALLKPIGRKADADPLAPIKAQLAQVDRDLEQGVLSAQEADATRIEIQRRLLRADKGTSTAEVSAGPRLGPHTALAIIGLGSALLYALLGRPDVAPAVPARVELNDQKLGNEDITLGEALVTLKAAVAREPDNTEPLAFLARTAMEAQDWSLAANSYAKLATLDPANAPDALLRRFLALLSLTNNQVSPAAELALADFEGAAPGHPAIDYYRGLAALQKRDTQTAYTLWSALLARTPKSIWFRAEVEAILPQIAPRGSARAEAPASGAPAIAPRLSAEQMASVESMSPEEQQTMIRSMLGRLRGYLDDNPTDVSAWLRLAQAHMVLGEIDVARDTLTDALKAVPASEQGPIKAMLDNLPK